MQKHLEFMVESLFPERFYGSSGSFSIRKNDARFIFFKEAARPVFVGSSRRQLFLSIVKEASVDFFFPFICCHIVAPNTTRSTAHLQKIL